MLINHGRQMLKITKTGAADEKYTILYIVSSAAGSKMLTGYVFLSTLSYSRTVQCTIVFDID